MTINPVRGCGTKKEDSFYLEASMSPGGTLSLWTWLLGDGLTDDGLLYWQPPPRTAIQFRPLESIALRSIYAVHDEPFPNNYPHSDFQALYGKMPWVAILDHVGENNYSAMSFRREVNELGPSRRVTRQFAETVARFIYDYGPCPLFFTHSRMPVFASEEQRHEAWLLANALNGQQTDGRQADFTPTWRGEEWGLFAIQDSGYGSSMIDILAMVDRLDRNWTAYKGMASAVKAKALFDTVNYVEQPFGATWVTHVSYTLPKDSSAVADDIDTIPGLRILDLEKDEVVSYVPEAVA